MAEFGNFNCRHSSISALGLRRAMANSNAYHNEGDGMTAINQNAALDG